MGVSGEGDPCTSHRVLRDLAVPGLWMCAGGWMVQSAEEGLEGTPSISVAAFHFSFLA